MLRPHPQGSILSESGVPTNDFKDWLTSLHQSVNQGTPPASFLNILSNTNIPIQNGSQDLLIRVGSGTSGDVAITADPQISFGAFDGQRITVEGTNNTKTVTLQNGRGLSLTGGTAFTLKQGSIIQFHFNQARSLWIETSRTT